MPWSHDRIKAHCGKIFWIGERMKKNSYEGNLAKSYFWRTVQQQEIDYVEETAGKITGYEIKWSANAKVKSPGCLKKLITQK